MKKMISKVIPILLVFCIALSLCACEKPSEDIAISHRTTLSREALGTDVFSVTSSDPSVARATLLENGGIRISAERVGTAVLTLRTPYAERFEITAVCTQDGITLSGGYTPPENSVFATDFGAIADDALEDTVAIQKAIDSLLNGGTVYIPKGVYLISQLILREGISVRLEGQLNDYTLSFEASGAMDLERNGSLAILRSCGKGDMFLNHPARDYGRNGCGNVTISGGLLDMQGRVRCMMFSCGKNITLENVIFKDSPNNHAIQLGGCENVLIRDCMFAGYNYTKSNTGAELIQIEQTHPGAMGAVSNTPSVFEAGETYFCSNITISGCYFGQSNNYDAPTYAIGHHGQSYRSSVTGLTITGCVFDNCRCSAIHYAAFSYVAIAGNTFINDRDNSVSPLDTPSQVRLYLYNKDITYTAPDGTQVYYAKKATGQGSFNTCIENNRFVIGPQCSQYSALSAEGNQQGYGVMYEAGVLQSGGYGQTPQYYSGYQAVNNKISGLIVQDNTVEVSALHDSRGYFFRFSNVYGLELEGNTVQGKSFLFCSTKFGGKSYENCEILGCTTAQTENSRLIVQLAPNSSGAVCTVSATDGQTVRLRSATKNSPSVTFRAEGGRIEYTIGENGDISITLIPEEGKTFRQWKWPENVQQDADGTYLFSFSAELTAVFE